MGLSAFHTHFKRMLSLSPGQYQKRLRLIEARRLMLDEGASASSASFEVGYESISQFTREYARLFKVPPKRDALRIRSELGRGTSCNPPGDSTGGADKRPRHEETPSCGHSARD